VKVQCGGFVLRLDKSEKREERRNWNMHRRPGIFEVGVRDTLIRPVISLTLLRRVVTRRCSPLSSFYRRFLSLSMRRSYTPTASAIATSTKIVIGRPAEEERSGRSPISFLKVRSHPRSSRAALRACQRLS
jgi:hypothetical protein